jgi:predicted nucleic-acid-binding Zn-ribbon protein
MDEVKKCPRRDGKMLLGSEQNLDDTFRCTRPKLKKLERCGYRIQSYICSDCGYIEFYKEKKE